jgi:hypothetical protein
MLMLQDYGLWIFFIVLYLFSLLFNPINSLIEKPCKIVKYDARQIEFLIKPIIYYVLAMIHAIVGLFIAFCFLISLISPDLARMICPYNISSTTNTNYTCEYLEKNFLGFQTSLIFHKIEKARLYKSESNSFNSPLNLIVSASDLDRNSFIIYTSQQLQFLLARLEIKLPFDINLEKRQITFPLKIDRQKYNYWLNEKQKIYDFIQQKTNKALIINQEISSTPINIYQVIDFIAKDIIIFSFPIFILCVFAPTVKCRLDLEQNSFHLQRQRFFWITTSQKNLELDKVEAILLQGTEDTDSFGDRFVLALRSGEEIPITYIFDNLGNSSKLEVCELANQLLKSRN